MIVTDTSASHPSLASQCNHPSLLEVSPTSPLTCVTSIVNVPVKTPAATTYSVNIDEDWLCKLCNAYSTDPWCAKLLSASHSMPDLVVKNGLWFIRDRFLVPANCRVCEHIFHIAHDSLGHFGFFKTYEAIKSSYFWLNMHKDLEEGYMLLLSFDLLGIL